LIDSDSSQLQQDDEGRMCHSAVAEKPARCRTLGTSEVHRPSQRRSDAVTEAGEGKRPAAQVGNATGRLT